jgi:hypothetical protein
MTLTDTHPVPVRPAPGLGRWCAVAAVGAAGAGVLHVAAAVGHREAGQLVVGLFLVAALAQCGGAWLLAVSALQARRPGAWSLAAALTGTLALVVLYVLAHTTDLLAGLAGSAAGAGHHAGAEAGGHGGTADPAAAAEPQGHSVATDGLVALSAEPEPVAHPPGPLGTATVAFELLCAVGLTALLPRTWRGWALDAQLVLGALGWVLWLTGVLG